MARCLLSRTWALRDAALLKTRLLVQDPGSGLDLREALPALSDALALGLDDKIAQVFMTSLGLLEALLAAAKTAKLRRSQVRACFFLSPFDALAFVCLICGRTAGRVP